MYIDISLERWTIRKLMAGAGEGGEVQKKNTRARKNEIEKIIHAKEL